jgi:hypothetical protein
MGKRASHVQDCFIANETTCNSDILSAILPVRVGAGFPDIMPAQKLEIR